MINKSIKTVKNYCCVCKNNESKIIANGTDFQYNTTEENFVWYQCCTCGHLYLNPIPSKQSLKIIYPENLGNYENFENKPGLGFKIKRILDKKSLINILKLIEKPTSFLDVGCASGTLLDLVKECNPKIKKLDGIEISKNAAKLALKKGHSVFIGTVDDVDLGKNKYDIIFLQQVIEHVHQPNFTICKLKKHLSKNGLLVLETPAPSTWDHKLFKKRYWEGYHFPRHFNIWTVDGMRLMLSQNGLKIISHKFRIKPVNWTLSIQNWITDKKKFLFFKNSLNMNSKFPLALIIFGVIDVVQLLLTKKCSDIQYIIKKNN